MKKSDLIINIFGNDLYEFLYSNYIDEKLSTTEIAKILEDHIEERVSAGNVWTLLKYFDIPIRSISDAVSISKMILNKDKTYLDSSSKMDVIDGLMISDATISAIGKYHRFSIDSSQKEFIDYCYSHLSEVCSTVPEFYSYKSVKNGRAGTWGIRTGIHPDFTKQYNRWYKNGNKIIPPDMSLSKMSVMLWYYGDGTIINGNASNSSNSSTIRLSTDSFSKDDVDMIIQRMSIELGIESVRTKDGRIRIKSEHIPNFINYIGRKPILSCYSYKFDVAEWRFWKTMKQAAKEIGIPYSRLSHLVKLDAVKYSRSPGGKKVMFTDRQMQELKSLHSADALMADARKSNIAVSKGKFNKVPKDLSSYLKSIREIGFPYIQLNNEELISSFNNLKNVPSIHINDRDFDASYRNNDIAINFHNHLYGVKCGDDKSPIEAFNNDEIMCDIIENSLKKGRSLAGKELLSDICHYKYVKRTSVFPVRVAKTLFARFGRNNMKVLDPCAGYSSRLIGFIAQGYTGNYIGFDPCKSTINGINNTIEAVKKLGLDSANHEYNIICGCAEEQMNKLDSNVFDIIFTSPPYFNLEKYDIDDSQSYIKYPSYEIWKEKFLFEIIRQSKRLMKENGIFLLNVGNCRENNIINDVDKFTKDIFRVENVLLMHSPSVWNDPTTEPIFCLRKN